MTRLRLTQCFPFLLPLRQKQRKLFFYTKMKFDSNRYSHQTALELPYVVVRQTVAMVNRQSGQDIKYQYNKVHNLKLAAACLQDLLIAPGETFSFWRLVKDADKDTPYKEGLVVVNGNLVTTIGGGLCQLSNLLFACFLQTELTIVERKGHAVETIYSDEPVAGIDATLSEGWIDLKARNETDHAFQLHFDFEDEQMTLSILSDSDDHPKMEVFNPEVTYLRKNGKIIQRAVVARKIYRQGQMTIEPLYINRTEIAYPLPENTPISEEEIA